MNRSMSSRSMRRCARQPLTKLNHYRNGSKTAQGTSRPMADKAERGPGKGLLALQVDAREPG